MFSSGWYSTLPIASGEQIILRQTGKSTPCREINTPALLRPLPVGKTPTPPDREIFHVGKYTLRHLGDRLRKDSQPKWLSPPLVGPRTLRLLSFCEAKHTTALQKVAFPFFWPLHSSSCCRSAKSNIPLRFRRWRFNISGRCTLRLLSFCKVEHTIAFQKVVFPSLWPLHASQHLMAHGSSLVGHINTDNVLTVQTYCHMLGAKTSPENPSSNLFPNISCFTVRPISLLTLSLLTLLESNFPGKSLGNP